jgi:hypothetical protein
MSSADRLSQLRELVGRLELLPATEERDSVLRKARARAVDVDTGVTTRPGVARPHAVAARDPRATPPAVARIVPFGAWRSRAPGRGRSPVGDAVAIQRSSDVLAADRRLCLEDVEAPDAGALGPRASGAWTRGLRG